jgi:hypothetical protein
LLLRNISTATALSFYYLWQLYSRVRCVLVRLRLRKKVVCVLSFIILIHHFFTLWNSPSLGLRVRCVVLCCVARLLEAAAQELRGDEQQPLLACVPCCVCDWW